MKMRFAVSAAVLIAGLLSANVSSAARCAFPTGRPASRGALYVFVAGTSVKGGSVFDPGFVSVFQADLSRIASSLHLRDVELFPYSPGGNVALVTWTPNSPHVLALMKASLLALPYVLGATVRIAAEPDGAGAVPAPAPARASVGPQTWSELKAAYR